MRIVAFIVGLAFAAVAIVYWTMPAGSLPSFLPGFEAGSWFAMFAPRGTPAEVIATLNRAVNEIIAEKAIAYHGRGVVGIDIAGPETATFRPRDYRRLFDRARRQGLGITVHAGEAGPVEEIAEVIELLEPDRIGHGEQRAVPSHAGQACGHGNIRGRLGDEC